MLSRIHSAEYLAFVNDLSKELERKRKQQLIEDAQSENMVDAPDTEQPRTVVPFTPMVRSSMLLRCMFGLDSHSHLITFVQL